uniref:Si:ch1073-272o11.3 n=1 Tax=Astyanax mexicanus TaxID=7994 RepID=A0A8B9KVE6_ASTMX
MSIIYMDTVFLCTDLHLAAELGKTLLERNHELEQALQQMYSNNQEQQQEIEYLSKQVDSLRSVNDQHAKVYEQLDATARDLEQSNQRLVLDNRSAQLKIEGLTETINALQCQMEELQKEMTEIKMVPSEHTTPDLLMFPPFEHSASVSTPSVEEEYWEEEHSAHLHCVESLQAQLNAERALREAAEQDAETLARELSELEPRLTLLDSYKARLAEIEAEVEELRQLWRSDSALAGAGRVHRLLLPDTVYLSSEEDRKFASICRGQTETVKYHRGISLLNEVDAEYSALQRKYSALLRRCEDKPQALSHKAVQTSPITEHTTPPLAKNTCSQGVGTQDNANAPEYKVLFNEIFTCIQRSKENLRENRTTKNHSGYNQGCND